jgi:hypothetical protein
MKGLKNLIYMSIAVGMLIYAVPQLEMGQGLTLPTVFGIVWIGMALLIIAAHLHQLIGVDEETKKELVRINKYKKWRMEQFILGKSKVMRARKD